MFLALIRFTKLVIMLHRIENAVASEMVDQITSKSFKGHVRLKIYALLYRPNHIDQSISPYSGLILI